MARHIETPIVLACLTIGCVDLSPPPDPVLIVPSPPPVAIDCTKQPEDPSCKRADPCGERPELGYVCPGGAAPPCQCTVTGAGAAAWRCDACPALDCTTTPDDPLCNKDAACIRCHGLATQPGGRGIENPHPWRYIGCTECHGGTGVDPASPGRALSAEEAHVHIPHEIAQDGSITTPKRTAYANSYLGRAGVERLAGGIEWIRFMNPSDLRVVDQTCARSACHAGAGEKVRRSVMSTLAGKFDAMLYATGIGRHPEMKRAMGNGPADKRLATYGAISVDDPTYDRSRDPPGAVRAVRALETVDRESVKPFGTFTEEDILKETVNKACGSCHLNNNGTNDKFGVFRSSGCSACHMPYDYSGRSQSGDPMIPKDEPKYPAAYQAIEYPERPHPVRHQITRVPQGKDCLSCHTGSARVVFQYWGIRTDDNRDLTRAKARGVDVDFRLSNLIDNRREPAARLHGFTQDQLIEYEDLDQDGQDDTPPDLHHEAGMDCIDCHTASEMHGDGKIYGRQNQATKVRCAHCHGTLDHVADPDSPDNPINELFRVAGAVQKKYLWKFDTVPTYGAGGFPQVKQPGIWLRTKSRGEWRYVPQIRWGVQWDPQAQDCIGDGRRIDPRDGGPVCTPAASIAHGRWNGLNAAAGDLDDGVGPRPNDEVVSAADGTTGARFGFSHLGEQPYDPLAAQAAGLECSACHAAWHNMRYGNHLGLVDTDGRNRFYDWDRVTGQTTLGKQGWFDFTFVDMLDLQLGVNPKGKITWLLPARLKLFVRETVLRNDAPFELMTQVGDARHAWKTYRDRVGFGNLIQGAAPAVRNAPGWASICLEPEGYCDSDPKKNINGGLGMDMMESHAIRRRARDCTGCHLDARGGGQERIGAVYGWSPRGYTPATSAYLRRITDIATPHGDYQTRDGFVIEDDGIEHRLDWLVDEATGYPLVYTLHPRTDDGRDGRPARGYDTYARDAAGPIGKQLIDQLKRIRVKNIQP